MNNFFLSGMGRSGTTLLEKLLCSHPELSILSQPLPLLFVGLKKIFLEKYGIDKYYVLNDDFVSRSYDFEKFHQFIDDYNFDEKELVNLFMNMDNYSGQKTKINWKEINLSSANILTIYRSLIYELSYNKKANLFGSKEIMCEEFIPSMIESGFKSIIIVRDPRDVLASANYSKQEKYLGKKKPSLFILKSWRKSVEYIQLLNSERNNHFVKYEDLVQNTYIELNRITKFLNVEKFSNNHFEKGIKDQNGKLWSANTSYYDKSSFISQNSLGAYKNVLSKEEIEYTEAICFDEMKWLGYSVEDDLINRVDVIKNFKDNNIEDQLYLPADYSSKQNNVDLEITRINNTRYGGKK